MENDLEKYLHILNSERCLKKPKEAIIIIEKICDCFKQEQSQFTIRLLMGLVLDETNAIFTFIWNTCSEFESVSSAIEALKFLNYLVTNLQKSTEPYFSTLFEKGLYLLDVKFAKVKEVSLKLIKNLIVADSKNLLDLSKLTEKLEKHLREDNKIPGTVLEEIYSLLGYLFEKYPESVKNEGKWFFNEMCETLRYNIQVAKNPSSSKIKGAFEGINGYLQSYPLPGPEYSNRIYDFMKAFSKWRQDRKLASRAALKIFHNHWRHFSKLVYDDRDFWKSNLSVWIKQSAEDRQAGISALSSFYSIIAFFIKQDLDAKVLTSYLKEFTETLSSSCSNPSEKRSVLIGIKLFVLTNCLTGDDFKNTYEVLMNFIRKQESYDNFTYLPLCIECVSAFVWRFTTDESFHNEQLSCLQRLSVKVIDHYPKIESDFQPQALTSLEKSFYMLGLCNLQILENHIDRVLYQGLIRSVSLMTVIDLELLKESGQKDVDSISYKSYLSLWKYFLNLINSPNRPVDGSFALKKGIASKVFDAFVESFLKIISKLNFNVGVHREVLVEKPSDLNIFINCVDLYQDLIPTIDSFNLLKWLVKIFQTLIHLSYRNPLVAGFYRLLTTTLKTADRLQFFEDCTGEDKNLKCFELVRKFLEDVLMKVDQYKGDLQVACLKTLLAAPVPLIESFMEKTIPSLEVIIHIGRGYFPLLRDLVEALERWDFHLPPATMNEIMRKVLPHFDVFFQSPYFRGNSLVDSSIKGKKLKKKLVFNDSELLTLQKKFLIFLGHTDVNKALNLIESPESPEEERIISDRNLSYQLPFRNGQTEINLDEILLRVMDLAVSCSDRRTRITACEFLYSAVMIILSNINQLSGGYTWLFRKIIRTCLILGCDSDSIVCQIFEPLMYQITHYFSGKKALHFSETKDLIDILMDSVTRPYDPAIRDFSALLICEFTVWSIKQLTTEELKVTPDSIKRILNKVYSLALHPSYNKRIGAAVVFNKIYPVLREEDFILEAYWFQLFYYFMESIRMCDGPEDVSEIREAIKHIKRPLMEKHQEFNKVSQHRVVPPEFEGGLLGHLVKWTVERCHDLRTSTRKVAMNMAQELAPLVSDCGSLISFFNKYFSKNSFQLKEKPLNKVDCTEEDFNDWLRYQCAVFEYYNWLLDQKVVSPEDVFRLGFSGISKNYISEILPEGRNRMGGEHLMQESVVLYLNLLYALRERAFYFTIEVWNLLQISVFSPSELGFDLNHVTRCESLFSILTDLLKFFTVKLLHYNWNYFYENLEFIITVPLISYITRNRQVGLKAHEFLFALKIIEASGLWQTFMSRMLFSMDGGFIVKTIFRCLFFKQGKNVYAGALEPSCKLYLDEFLKVALRVSTDPEEMLNCIENPEEVLEEETGKVMKKGEYFQVQFKSTVFGYLETKHSALVERVISRGDAEGVKLLIRILENIKQEDTHGDLPKEIFRRWRDLEKIGPSKEQKKILLHLAVCGARVIGIPGFLKVSPIADEIFASLENEKFEEMNAGEIEAIFGLLPFLSNFGEGTNENDRLDASLSKFKIDQKALKRSVTQGLLQRTTINSAINGLLRSLKLTASLVLLRFIISKASWFEAASNREDVESALTVFADIKTPLSHSVSALRLAYSQCFENPKMSSFVSLVYTWFLSPLMRILPKAAVQQVVNDNLNKLCDLITNLGGENLKNLSMIATDLRRRICAARIIQTFVNKLTKEEVNELAVEKKNLIDKIPGRCFPLLKQPPPGNALKERHRKFMCEVFNMICSIICARCTNPKFYKLFIFDERGSFLYAAVDNTMVYNLTMDFDEIPKRKKHLTLLRKNITKERRGFLDQSLSSVKYIQTNTLFTSSLQEDVTQFDLTYSPIRPLNSLQNFDSQETIKHMEIELEMDALNSHECMTTLVGVITKMVREGMVEEEGTEIPCWLKFFLSALNNPKLSKNMKLFVLKAIYNVQNYVQPFSHKAFPVVLDSILNIFAGYPINYFLIDLIEMMIGWKELPKQEISPRQMTVLVSLVLKKCDSLRRDIVKNNLEVIKMMIELWKDSLCLYDLSSEAFDRLSMSAERDTKSKISISDSDTYLNIQICGILLANGIPSWREGHEKQFFDLILRNFQEENKKKEFFGEICGLALKCIEYKNASVLENYVKMVQEKISQAVSWLPLLYGVHKHYPKMSSLFTFKIFSSAWDSTDSLTVNKLEMLLSHVSRQDAPEDDTFKRHAHVFLIDMLNCTDAAVQELSLQITEKLLDNLNDEKLQMLLREVLKLQKSVHPGVRKWVYKIAMKSYRQTQQPGVMRQCKVILLKGLNDGVKSMEEACLRFWCGFLQLSTPYLILMHIFQEMYTPETESIFLCIAAKILMESAAEDNQFVKSISPHPITHQCKFQKRTLVLGLRSSALLTTSRTWKNQSLELTATLRNTNLPYLRPTMSSLKFQPTLLENPEEVTPANADTPEEEDIELPRNPLKVRFYKSATKTNFSFLRRHKQKKKRESEEEEELMRKKETEVEILGEYRLGDYPDIQISHSQVLRPLEALTKVDNQIARQFLVAFYSGLMKIVKIDEKTTLLSETNKCFENILKSSTSFDPGVFGFVLQVFLQHSQNLEIDCELISNAAISSNWLSLGALIIEENIAQQEDFQAESSKKRRGNQNSERKRWLELAKLYRSLEEFDVLSGIFLDKLSVEGDAKKALQSESLMDWASASKYYETILQTDEGSRQSEFYTESYFSCLAKLSNWSLLNKCIRITVDQNLDNLWQNYNLLSWFLKSEMMTSLRGNPSEVQNIFEEFCKSKSQLNVLSTNFGEELAVFDWLLNKLQRANYRIDRLCLDFLAGWSHLNRWSYNLRAAKLVNLQTLSELCFAVRTLAESSKSQREENLKMGGKRWEKNVPSSRDDLMVWDVKLGYRGEFLKRLNDDSLTVAGIESDLALAKAALSQNNLSLTKECLSRVKQMLPEGNGALRAEYDYCFNLGKMVVAKSKMTNENVGLEMYLGVWKGIAHQLSSAMDTDSSVSQTHKFRCYYTLGELVAAILPSVIDQSASPEILKSISLRLGSPANAESIIGPLKNKGLEYFEAARDVLESVGGSAATKANTYLELAKFILKFLDKSSFLEFEKFCTCLLKSMHLGSAEARRLFGCTLNMPDLIRNVPSLKGLISECESVPSWMFLMWINQMLASLNSKMFPFLKSIILRVAQEYPNSIRHAFRLNKEEYESRDPKTKSFFIKLSGLLLNDQLYENFFLSMNYLCPPDLILRHHLEAVLQEANHDDANSTKIKSTLTKLHELLFSANYEKFRGSVFKFCEKFKQPLEDALGAGNDKEVLRKKIKCVLSSLETAKLPSRRALRDLESYSPWLHNFHALKAEATLELPGQYDGNREPIKKNLVTVSSFRSDVLVFDSKCRPMRITVLGNDAAEHKFLIKFGEDLRQDQRIQQVFEHFNNRLKEEKQTRRFYLQTYKVIPLTVSLGMIEWIENNISLYEMIENSLGHETNRIVKAQTEHLAFLSQDPKVEPNGGSVTRAHLNGYEKLERESAVSNFNARAQLFPRDLLKKAFTDLSTSPEHFIYLRGNFATSHAVMCVTHWLVGIGDRHLQNILVSTKTGRVLGIDFGYAFGFATQFLVPPELIPFRLTPQILGLMDPIKESGWIKQTMVHCLRLFRKEHFELSFILEVFVLEPVMDWLKHAKKSERCQTESSDSWYPRQKISMVEKKLNGANPVSIFETDLREGHSQSKYLEKYLKVLKGVEQFNVRARCKEDGLTEDEQADCLIDLATDPHVLSKTYVGWNPWL